MWKKSRPLGYVIQDYGRSLKLYLSNFKLKQNGSEV